MNSQDDHTITGLPTTYPIDPSLSSDIHQQHHQHHHHHQHHQHDDIINDHDVHGGVHDQDDLDAQATLAAEYFASAAAANVGGVGVDGGAGGGDLNLGDATLVGGGRDEVPLLPGEHNHQQNGKPKKKKLQLACHFCRRRKLKCDGQKPSCDNCTKRNETCDWDDNVRRRGPGKRTKALRDRGASDNVDGSLHDVSGLDGSSVLDSSAFTLGDGVHGDESGSSVADTNAALIAAVTAAAAEGAGGSGLDDGFGGEDMTTLDVEGYVGDGSSTPTSAHLGHQHQHQDLSSSKSKSTDPNIDPTLSELGAEASTLSEIDNSKLSSNASTATSGVPQSNQQQIIIDQLRSQKLAARFYAEEMERHDREQEALRQDLQRQRSLQQLQQLQQQQQLQQRKLPGVGVGVGVVQHPTFGANPQQQQQQSSQTGGQQTHSQSLDSSSASTAAEAALDNASADMDWSKSYFTASWPEI